MSSIRELQSKLVSTTVNDSLSDSYRAMCKLDMLVIQKGKPDAAVADLLIAVVRLADALGVDAETAVKSRLLPQGALLMPLRIER